MRGSPPSLPAYEQRLDGTWLTLGIDDLIHALSHGPGDVGGGGTIDFAPDGSITVGEEFRHRGGRMVRGVGRDGPRRLGCHR